MFSNRKNQPLTSGASGQGNPSRSTIKSYYCHENKDSLTALHLMCKRENLPAIRDIVTYQPGLVSKPTSKRGDTPLMFAVASQNIQVIRYLVTLCPESVGMRSNDFGTFGDRITPLHLAISTKAGLEIIEILVMAYGKALRTRSGSGETPYQLAFGTYRTVERDEVLDLLQKYDTSR